MSRLAIILILGMFLCRERISRGCSSVLGYERFEQRLEPRTQPQFLALVLEQLARVAGFLECIAEVRQPHEPQRVGDVLFDTDAKCDPTGIRTPPMLFGE